MLTFTSFQLHALATAFLLPFCRILGLFSADPVLGHTAVPVRVRIALAFCLAWLIVPTLPAPAPGVDITGLDGALLLAQQTLVGLAMGFSIRLAFAAADLAGQLIGLQTGLGFASFYDPGQAQQGIITGTFLRLMALMLFVTSDGHLLVLEALAASFTILPADAFVPRSLADLAFLGGRLFQVGLQLALPVLAVLLIVNLGLGALMRIAPQINLLMLSLPLTVIAGLFILMLVIPLLGQAMLPWLNESTTWVPALLQPGSR